MVKNNKKPDSERGTGFSADTISGYMWIDYYTKKLFNYGNAKKSGNYRWRVRRH
jgi:hypothetical protein